MGESKFIRMILGKESKQSNTEALSCEKPLSGTTGGQSGRDKVFKMVPGIQTRGRYYEKGDVFQEQWLGMFRRQQEIVLAWLSAASVSAPLKEGEHKVKAQWRYLLTSDRSMLVGFLKDRSVCVYEMQAKPLEIVDKIGRNLVRSGEYEWKAALSHGQYYRELAPLPGLDRWARIWETARLNTVHMNARKRQVSLALWLVKIVRKAIYNPVDCLSQAYLESVIARESQASQTELDIMSMETLHQCIDRLFENRENDQFLTEWARSWNVLPDFQLALTRFLFKAYPQCPKPTISLFYHARSLKAVKDPLPQIEQDIAFAQILMEINQRGEAVRLLENSLAVLSKPAIEDLLPLPQEKDDANQIHTIRFRLLENLAQAKRSGSALDQSTIAEIARLQPLDITRIHALTEVSEGSLNKRAYALSLVLDTNGLSPSPSEPPAIRVKPLTEELVESKLLYPDAPEGTTIDALKNWLGKARVPDYNLLKSYAERVHQKNYPQVLLTLTDNSIVLGLKAVEAYVARGEKSVGIQAYEGKPPFLLIGIEHLEPESVFFMTPLELRFAIAAEMAHLRFHHTRLTSSEVWDGVFSKGRQALELIAALSGPLGLLGNAARGLQRITRFERLMQKAESLTFGIKKAVDLAGVAKGVKDTADNVTDKLSRTASEPIEDEETLLEACRQMQLTADRAGLVMCGNIKASIRAMFLISRHYAAELQIVERYSLTHALIQRDTKGKLLYKELALRVAALCSFYLSNDFETLSTALIKE